MRYMLDTNVISALEKAPTGPLLTKLSNAGIDQIATSVIVAGELEYGSAKVRATRLRDNLKTLLGEIGVLPIDASVAQSYGRVRADLERRGKPIGQNDMWIAAHAIALDLTLVTDNVDEFARVDGLRVENWLRD